MRISVTRSGGFAGRTIHREIDTAALAGGAEIERLAASAVSHPGGASMPDAFRYEVAIDGVNYVVGDEHPAWRALIERIFGLQ